MFHIPPRVNQGMGSGPNKRTVTLPKGLLVDKSYTSYNSLNGVSFASSSYICMVLLVQEI